MATSSEIHEATASTMEALNPLRVLYLEGAREEGAGVAYEYECFSVLFTYLLCGFEGNCLVSRDVSISDLFKRTWYYSGGLVCESKKMTDAEINLRAISYLDLDEKEAYNAFAKEVSEFLSDRNCSNKFHNVVANIDPASDEEMYRKFLESSNVYIKVE